MNKKDIVKEITYLTTLLVECGLVEKQNLPSDNNGQIYISGDFDHSISLKTNVNYRDIYKVLREQNNYNLLFLDGAIVQIMYKFDNRNNLIKSRLCYFPCPDLLSFDEGEDSYDNDDIYADIIHNNILPTAIRFDFDPSCHEEVFHSCSHVTFGQYKNCRIPVTAPLTPFRFIDFIIRNFYHNGFRSIINDFNKIKTKDFSTSMTKLESEIIHLNYF